MFAPRFDISSELSADLKRQAVLVHELNQRSLTDERYKALVSKARLDTICAEASLEGEPLSPDRIATCLEASPTHLRGGEREAYSHHAVLTTLTGRDLSAELVLELHHSVMQGSVPADQCGAYRLEPVFVLDPAGNDVAFWPPYPHQVPHHMRALYAYLDKHRELDPVIRAGLFHKQLLLIHPFLSGNGRIARLAAATLLRSLGLKYLDLLSLGVSFYRDREGYFRTVSEVGNFYDLDPDFTPWLEYFATGLRTELERLMDVLEHRAQPLHLKAHHRCILSHLAEHGTVTDKEYAGLVDRAKATRVLDFRCLIEQGLIRRQGRGPAVYYVLAHAKRD